MVCHLFVIIPVLSLSVRLIFLFNEALPKVCIEIRLKLKYIVQILGFCNKLDCTGNFLLVFD